MIKVDNLVTPSPEQWKAVVHGMRLPLMSHDRSDSFILDYEPRAEDPTANYYVNDKLLGREWQLSEEQEEFVNNPKGELVSRIDCESSFYLGEADKKLMLDLASTGASDRKFLRQLPVLMEITAPEVFWRQMDTYKLGTTAQSSSQMHCLFKEPFKLEDFSFTSGYDKENEELVSVLNQKRDLYFEEDDPETKKKIKRDVIDHIPQSFNYTRCWSANYEILLNIIKQRRKHPISEWDQLIDYWLEKIPLLKELNEVVNG